MTDKNDLEMSQFGRKTGGAAPYKNHFNLSFFDFLGFIRRRQNLPIKR
jgi:hypothetical protein